MSALICFEIKENSKIPNQIKEGLQQLEALVKTETTKPGIKVLLISVPQP
jgi:hypothetical protein